jgi:hypothetical protein
MALWEASVGFVILMEGKRKLAKIVLASGAGGGFPNPLHGGQRQPDQDRDDPDHDQ